jgi:hypothetical protein
MIRARLIGEFAGHTYMIEVMPCCGPLVMRWCCDKWVEVGPDIPEACGLAWERLVRDARK